MKNQNTSLSTRSWITSCSLFLTTVILISYAQSVGNNFDQQQLYVAILVLPELFFLLGVIILQKFIEPKVLITILTIYEVVLLFLFSFVSMSFETYNADSMLFIYGYHMVYNKYIYSMMISGAPAIMYLTLLERIKEFKELKVSTPAIISRTFQDAFWIVGLSIVSIVLANYLSLGLSHAFLGTVLGISLLKDKVSQNQRPDNPYTTQNRESEPLLINVQEHSKGKNTFLAIIMTFVFLILSSAWKIDHIKYIKVMDGLESVIIPWYLLLNERLIIAESLTSMILFEIVLLALMAGFKKIGDKAGRSVNLECILALVTTGLIAAMWFPIFIDFSILGIRPQTLLSPWIILLCTCWIVVFAIRRTRASPGIIGAAMMATLFSMWIGVFLDGGEIEYTELILTGFALIIAVFTFILYFLVTPRVLEHRRFFTRGEKFGAVNRKPSAKIRKKLGIGLLKKSQEAPRWVAPVLIAAIIAVPVGQTFYFSTSPSNFQVLANVDNYAIFYLADPMTRVDKYYRPNFGLSSYSNPNNTIQIHAAKNEYESVQVVMLPTGRKHFSIYDISFSGFARVGNPSDTINSSNFKAYRVHYVEELDNIIADRLGFLTICSCGWNECASLVHVPRSIKCDRRGLHGKNHPHHG
ncbi:MAG: hypothetical protein ACFFCS_02225 [Candidatus Hodarchaeota archaeon]